MTTTIKVGIFVAFCSVFYYVQISSSFCFINHYTAFFSPFYLFFCLIFLAGHLCFWAYAFVFGWHFIEWSNTQSLAYTYGFSLLVSEYIFLLITILSFTRAFGIFLTSS